MNDSPEFTAMLEKIPTHIMLTPGVHKWQEGDEFGIYNGHSFQWCRVEHNTVEPKDQRGWPIRRIVPEPIRRNAAFWELADSLLNIRLAPYVDDKCAYGEWYSEMTDEKLRMLGGKDAFETHLSSGCLLPKWMAGEI